jgi:hypothetical protein
MRGRKGQFLIEGMIAMGIIVSSILGIFSLAVSALRVSSTVTSQFIAANLAAEGLEVTKNILDSNVARGNLSWNDGFAEDRCFEVDYKQETIAEELLGCDENDAEFLKINSSGLYGYEAGEQTVFKRWVETTPDPDSNLKIRAIATVAWSDPRRPETVQISQIATDFIGWRLE